MVERAKRKRKSPKNAVNTQACRCMGQRVKPVFVNDSTRSSYRFIQFLNWILHHDDIHLIHNGELL